MLSLTLYDFSLIILLSSFVVRVFMLGIATIKFAILCGGKVREGLSLFRALDIPGLGTFIRQECITGLLPYLAIYVIMWRTKLSDLLLSDLNFILIVLTIIVLGCWVVLDWLRSVKLYLELSSIIKEVHILSNVAGTTLDGLRYVVYLRGGVIKSSFRIGARLAFGKAKEKANEKLEENEKEKGKKSLGRTALLLLDKVVSIPEKVVGSITDWAKDSIDEKLKKRFGVYLERSTTYTLLLYLWSLVPAIWLFTIFKIGMV
jgi:hypothetical protein